MKDITPCNGGIASIPNKNSMASLLAMQVEKYYYIKKNGSGLYVFQLSIS
jgi:hypothetical protein